MGQLGFFDADKRLEALSAKGDPLEVIDRLVPWESFRAEIEAVVLTPDELKKSSAGRKPFDAILMFRMLVLQALNNLSGEQVEYQVRDRLSFSRFLGRDRGASHRRPHGAIAKEVRKHPVKRRVWNGTVDDLLDIVGPTTKIKSTKKLSDDLRRLGPMLL